MKKRIWSADELDVLQTCWGTMPIAQLAKKLECSPTHMYKVANSIGLPISEVLKWTEEQELFLKKYYKIKTDVWIAGKLQNKYPRAPAWNSYNVMKKRKRLKLECTAKEQQQKLHDYRGKERLSQISHQRWKNEAAVDGSLRYRDTPTRKIWEIKINGKWRGYMRYRYEELHGTLPKGWAVAAADRNPKNHADDNLLAMPANLRSQYARDACVELSDRFIAALLAREHGEDKDFFLQPQQAKIIAAKRTIIQLKRTLKTKNKNGL